MGRSALVVACLAIGCGGNVRTDGGTPSGGDRGTGFRLAAQAALSFSITPATGKVCNTTSAMLGFPSDDNANVATELDCDLSMGCKPDDYIVVDGDRGTTVACTVSPQDANFAVQLNLDVDGSATNKPSVHFGLVGLLSSTGGNVSINESNSIAGGGGMQSNCALLVTPPVGVIAKGKIFGRFECNALRDPADLDETGCDLHGELLFENCGY